jgi:lipopolysaccharide/colanic/teichoic acid biosynthesis glycosyltransferase
MLWRRIKGLWNTYHGILAVILTLVFWTYLAIVLVVFKFSSIQELQRFILYNLLAIVGLILAAIRGRSSAATLLTGGFVNCHTLALRQAVYVGVTMLVALLLATDAAVSRPLILLLLFGFLLVLYVVFVICHLFLPRWLADQSFSDKHEQRTLLIGPVEKAREIAKWIDETAALGFGMRGSVTDDDDRESRILLVTRVSDVGMLERIIRHEGIKQIILLEIPLDPEGLKLIVNTANKAGVRLLVLNNLTEIFNHDITFFTSHNREFIGLRDEPLEDLVSRILKRMIDLLVSLPVLLFVLPLACLLVKIFQAIQSPGPLFSRETRSGLGMRPFRSFNFRTVVAARSDATKQATANDERMYPLGRFLRKTGLHEMPQFFNVFLGNMSVVGPRPYTIVQNRRFSEIMDKYHVRTLAKPGVTGLAQVSGYRGEPDDEEDVVESARLDIKYIENWSLPLDLRIIFKAFFQFIRPPQAAR